MLAKEIKIGQYIEYKNIVYQLKKKETVVYGTHSHSKLKFFLKPVIGNGEQVITFMHTENVPTLDIIRKKGQIISLSENKAQIMDSVSFETFDADIHEDVSKDDLSEGKDATFINLKGNALIIDGR